MSEASSRLLCPACGTSPDAPQAAFVCACGELLDVEHTLARVDPALFDARRGSDDALDASGVWRFRELVHPAARVDAVVTLGEGGVPLVRAPRLAAWTGIDDFVVLHEGRNPTGSFKDRGMTVAVTQALCEGARRVACASTGNTAASVAAYAGAAGMEAIVLAPAGHTAPGKLAQARAHGARVLLLSGDFDAGMRLVRERARELGLYLLNSINPWRIEGQKAIVLELCQRLAWEPPDWFVFPAGNLGNCAAFGKALREMLRLGLIARAPRLAAVQASGAAPFAAAFARGFDALEPVRAETVATAIRIGDPVSWRRAARAIEETNGVVLAVTDDEILAAKREVDGAGIGAEHASCAAIAGTRALRGRGEIRSGDRVACVLTGHLLKDPGEGGLEPVEIQPTAAALRAALLR